MRIFITGATGFVGQHVIESASEAGHEIFASTLEKDKIENSTVNIRWIYSDLADLDSLKPALISFNPDIVIHLAWQGIPDYSELISRANLNNSINLLDFILSNIVSDEYFSYLNCVQSRSFSNIIGNNPHI